MLKIVNIKARYGDCFLIQSCDKYVNFLIDCGFKQTYKQEIRKLTNSVDFIILTHVDEDHIYGAIPLIEDYPDKFSFNRLYINTPSSCSVAKRAGNISISQSITLESLLKQKKIPYGSLVQGTNLNIDDKRISYIKKEGFSDLNIVLEKDNINSTREEIIFIKK